LHPVDRSTLSREQEISQCTRISEGTEEPARGKERCDQSGAQNLLVSLFALSRQECGRIRQHTGTGRRALESVSPGELFWFVTKGSPDNGMPAWANLPKTQRWEVVSYVKSLGLSEVASTREAAKEAPSTASGSIKAPPPKPPFTDFRYQKPGAVHKITVNDLP